MSSIWKHPLSKYWVACFTDNTGKQRKKSTKTTNRKQAEKIARDLEESYNKEATELQVRKLLQESYEDIHGEKMSNYTIRSYLTQWLESKKPEISPSTQSAYSIAVEKFLETIGKRADKDLAHLKTGDIILFRDKYAKKLAPKTVNRYIKSLRVAFNDAWKQDLMQDNPAAKVKTIKLKTPEVQRIAFTTEQVRLLLEVADEEWVGMILTGLYTGQRLGDIVRLKWSHVDLLNKIISFETQKTSRRIIVPIAEPLLRHLMSIASTDCASAPVFPEAYADYERHERVTCHSNQFYRLMVTAGIAKSRSTKATGLGRREARKVNELSFHCLRHTATSLLKNAGVSEAVAMDIIGHDSKEISLNYTHIEDNAKREALNKLPDLCI